MANSLSLILTVLIEINFYKIKENLQNAIENGDLFLGIGIAPKHCSKGLGKELLIHTITRAKEKYTDRNIVLQVRSWNKRAIKCYLKVGFEIIKIEVFFHIK